MLDKVRKILKEKNIDYALFLTADFHLSEYISDYFKLREYISSFKGSAGTLLVGQNEAFLFTDGRYFLQASKELNPEIKLIKDNDYIKYINENIKNKKIYIDLRTISYDNYLKIDSTNSIISDFSFFELLHDLSLPKEKIYKHKDDFVSKSSDEKINEIRKYLKSKNYDYCVITSLSDIAYISNLRGRDVEYNPVFLAYMIISLDEAVLYLDKDKLDESINIKIKPYDDFLEDLKTLKDNVLCDFANTNAKAILSINANLYNEILPSSLMKAIKDSKEISHIANAHINDGIALCKFNYWLDNAKNINEYDIGVKLAKLRAECPLYVSDSFSTIAGFNENGAIIHYKANKNCAKIIGDGILLVDSGAQYLNGTTDITRVFKINKASDEQKDDYTRVLKAHIALSRLIYPENIKPYLLDSIARQELWRVGLDYLHGTGHGVGYFLNVHEGPQVLSMYAKTENAVGLQEGMITSIEPGVYHENKYGIRIENLVASKFHSESKYARFLSFKTLTCFYYEIDLINKTLLNDDEIAWINSYHNEVYSKLKDHLSNELRDYLNHKTREI